MDDFLKFLQSHSRSPINVQFFKRNNASDHIQAEASYSVVVEEFIKETDDSLKLLCSNGMAGPGKSTVTIVFPSHSEFEQNENIWEISYRLSTEAVSIRCTFPKVLRVNKAEQTLSKPQIKEFRNDKGNLARIYIDIPEGSSDIYFVQKTEELLTQLLTTWRVFSLVRRIGVSTTWKYKRLQFESINAVTLPGNMFFELQAYESNELINIEVGTELAINLDKGILSFVFDDIQYELVRIK